MAEVLFHWPTGAPLGEKEMRLADIATGDSRQELLIRQRQSASEDPAHINHIFTYADGALTETRLEAPGDRPGAITLTGDGRVGIEESDCAHRKTTWHRLDGPLLRPDGEDLTLQPDAGQFKLPDGGYGCPG